MATRTNGQTPGYPGFDERNRVNSESGGPDIQPLHVDRYSGARAFGQRTCNLAILDTQALLTAIDPIPNQRCACGRSSCLQRDYVRASEHRAIGTGLHRKTLIVWMSRFDEVWVSRFRHPGADTQLLLAIAAMAAGETTDKPADEPVSDNPMSDDPATEARNAPTLALARAVRTQGRGNAEATLAAYAQALAAADRDGTPDVVVDASRFYLPQLIARREFDRASAIAGAIAPYAERDFRAARALAQLYRALDDQALLAQANARVKALAGERDVDKAVY